MNRTEYRLARRLFRDNGKYALTWMTPPIREVFQHIINQKDDPYEEIEFFLRGIPYPSVRSRLTFRQRLREYLRKHE
jgi:hypothetical protein